MNQRSRAHGTRLNCNKQVTVAQAMVADRGTCLSEGYDLCVGGGITIGQVPVPAAADNLALMNNDRAYGNFAGIECAAGTAQSLPHPEFVGVLGGTVAHANDCSLRGARL